MQDAQDISADVNISVVIPLFNEEGSLPELTERLHKVLSTLANERYEILYIDDGSTDSSLTILEREAAADNRVKVLSFQRNLGKSSALDIGFRHAQGEFVITMDADLQDDPDELPNLIGKLKDGYDLVSGWKKKRYDPISKTLPSKLFNYVTSKASGIRLHDFNCGLKAYRKAVVKALRVYGEMHRYLPALAHWMGFRVTELPVTHHARQHGVSKFGASRFVKGYLDLLTVLFTTRFAKRPLHLFGTSGSLLCVSGFLILAYLTIGWLLDSLYFANHVPLTLFGILLIIVGIQLVVMGLLGELVVRNTMEAQTEYIMKKEINIS